MTGPDGWGMFQVADGSTFEVFPNSRTVFRANQGDWRDLLSKLEEETAELVEAVDGSSETEERKQEIESEVGDLLFTAVNLGRHLGVDAEMALRGTNARFRARFREMEREAKESLGKPLGELPPETLEALWIRAKKRLAAHENEGVLGMDEVAGQ